MKESYVPRAYLQRLLDQAKQAGCELGPLLEHINLTAAQIAEATYIPARIYGELYRWVMRTTQNEWFGMFSGGGRVPLGSFRMMGLTILQCESLGQAIHRAGDFADICRGMNTRYFLDITYNKALLTLAPIRSLNKVLFQEMLRDAEPGGILTSLMTWHRYSEWLIDKSIPLLEVKLMCKEGDIKVPLAYGDLRNVKFSQDANSMSYDASFLECPIVQDEESLMAYLRTVPYHLVTEDPARATYSDKVRSILNRDVSKSMLSIEQIAVKVGISATTLRRHLQKEGTSFQRLKDGCRKEAAFHYLTYTELTSIDISERLGFDEPSTFFRLFKKWTGMTPGEYRANLF